MTRDYVANKSIMNNLPCDNDNDQVQSVGSHNHRLYLAGGQFP